MYFKTILKVTKNQGFALSLEDKFFEKPQGTIKLTRLLSGLLGLRHFQTYCNIVQNVRK